MLSESERSICFTKMHGIGNDYIYIDCTGRVPERLDDLAREMSDRHIGIGGDGIILICPSEVADFKMRIFNADGSEARMCGNGSRCVGKFIFDRHMIDGTTIKLETLAGIRHINIIKGDDGRATGATVDMGTPTVGDVIDIYGYKVIPVSTGNPHGVVFLDHDPTDTEVLADGPRLEHAPCWPDRANIEFVHVVGRDEARIRVWERGSGETMACGTGACATLAAGVTAGVLDDAATMHLPGGDLTIHWNRTTDNTLYMTGPAVEVFNGVYKRKNTTSR